VLVSNRLYANKIKAAFEQKYGKSLKEWIKGDTSFNYETLLLAVIGEHR